MITLAVTGMTCQHCVRAVEQAIKARDPGAEVTVNLAEGTVQACTLLTRDDVAAAVREAGYEPA